MLPSGEASHRKWAFKGDPCGFWPKGPFGEAYRAKGRRLNTTVAFLAETPGSATIEEQKACLGPDDIVVEAGRKSFNQLGELLARNGIKLDVGDRIKVFDLTCLALSTNMLIRVLTKMLRAGITFEIASPRIVIEPSAADQMHALLDALDGHYRHVHGIKTHPAATAPQGRKRLLDPDQLPEIRKKLDKPGATATDVAQELGVARSTLFNYLERYDRERRIGRDKKAIKGDAEDAGDDAHVSKGNTDQAPA